MKRLIVCFLLILCLLALVGCDLIGDAVAKVSDVGTEVGAEMNENVNTIREGMDVLARIGGVQ